MSYSVHVHRWCRFGALLVVALLALQGAAPVMAGVDTLSNAFSAASPGNGYDTMLVLDPANIYTGGLTLPAGNHCIVGNGAVINLQNQTLAAGSGVVLDVSGCSFTNGDNGLSFTDGATGHVECCNFYDNYNGLYVWEGAAVTVVSCNFIASDHYAVYRHEYGSIHNEFNNAWGNMVNDYVYFCPD